MLSKQGLSPVRERLSQSGADSRLLPFTAYFQKLTRQIPINNDLKIVKICYIVENNTPLLECLVKAAAAVPEIFICVIFDNSYSFIKAKKKFGSKAELLLCKDKERCDEVKRSSAFVRGLTADTTLSELMTEARGMGRFKANVKSVPTVFSHSLYGGGDLKNGFCTFRQNGKNVSYGEFIKNPFTEIKSVLTTFVPRLRAKIMKVTLADAKYRSGTQLFLLTEKGRALEVGGIAELSGERLSGGERLTVLSQCTEDGVLFAVQIFKNAKENEYLKKKMSEEGFFEGCEMAVKTENETELRHAEILSEFLDRKLSEGEKGFFTAELRRVIGSQVPRSFFSKMIFLSKSGELKGEKLYLAAKRYAEQFSDRKIFDICLPAAYTKNDEVGRGVEKTGERGLCDGNLGKEKSCERGFYEGGLGEEKTGERVLCDGDLGKGKSRKRGFYEGGLGEEKSGECGLCDGNLGKEKSCERGFYEGSLGEEKSGERGLREGSFGEVKTTEDKLFEIEYRYPFYIHCLDRIKNIEGIDGAIYEAKNGKRGFPEEKEN